MSKTKKIRWENRLINDTGNDALVTVDGTDFRIQEPIPFNRKWFSKKFNGPALRYEVGISINTGYIVWFNGPFPAGMMPDIKIFESNLKWKMSSGERVVADKGYTGVPQVLCPRSAKNDKHRKEMSKARARHETVNRRFKEWQCLQQRWRHDREKHHLVFSAVAGLTQIEILNGQPLYQIDYDSKIKF